MIKDYGSVNKIDIYSLIWRYYKNNFEKGFKMRAPHSHRAVEIDFVVDGTAFTRFKNCNVEMKKGSCLIIPSNVPHYFYVPDKSRCLLLDVHFIFNDILKDSYGSDKSSTLSFALENLQESYININKCYKIKNILEKLVKEMEEKEDNYEVIVKMSLIELLIIISRVLDEKKYTLQYVNAAINNIMENINEKLTLNNISKSINLSASYLSHIFKEQTGVSVMRFAQNERIEKSKDLLTDTSLNITDITSIVGMQNAQHFSAVFKKVTNITPSDYRNKGNNNKNKNIFN